ncbi:hypothetical protein VNO80_20492 [Phaseolus coccineus]|uniref:Uncharacterized protein n=1 Tax=Phaseolus coccineus TaxID=3886 RepID=A0AAN9QSC5_PHACN
MEQNIPVYVYAIEQLSHTRTRKQSCILILGENWPLFTFLLLDERDKFLGLYAILEGRRHESNEVLKGWGEMLGMAVAKIFVHLGKI